MKQHLNLLLGVCGATALAANANAAGRQPVNVVLINLDDAGNGDFSHKGAIGYLTPNIDRLAAEGMSMNNFYAVQPISGASRAGLLTGCYPNRIGFAYAPNPNWPTGISDKEQTMAQLLKDKGYATAFSANGILATPRSSCRCSMDLMSITDYLIPTTCGRSIRNTSFLTCRLSRAMR